jgi:hypothetical protein
MPVVRGLAVWALFIPLAILNGILRESVLIRLLGKPTALLLSGFLLCCLIFLITYLLFPWLKISSLQSWSVGITWVILTVLFELGFGHYVIGKSWDLLLQPYDLRTGNLWDVVLLFILVSPRLAAKLRGKTTIP